MPYVPISPTVNSGTVVAAQNLAVGTSAIAFAAFNTATNIVALQVLTNNVYVTFDQTTPSASNGATLYSNQSYHWAAQTAKNAKFIEVGSSARIFAQEFTVSLEASALPDCEVLKVPPLTQNGGSVTSITAGTGLSGGTITTSGTISLTIPVTVANGGTGTTSGFSATQILVGNGTSPITSSSNLTTDGSGNVTQAGNLTFSTAGDGPKGQAGNTAAAAGVVGERFTATLSSANAASLTTNTALNVCSVPLTAGIWLVWGYVYYSSGSGVTVNTYAAAINTTSNTLPGVNSGQQNEQSGTVSVVGIDGGLPVLPVRVAINSNTTTYLISAAGFTGGTLSTYGGMQAIRQMN